jgi:hypothetical protein
MQENQSLEQFDSSAVTHTVWDVSGAFRDERSGKVAQGGNLICTWPCHVRLWRGSAKAIGAMQVRAMCEQAYVWPATVALHLQ